jgi:hypothetical protein
MKALICHRIVMSGQTVVRLHVRATDLDFCLRPRLASERSALGLGIPKSRH